MKYNSIQALRCLAVMPVLVLHSHLALEQNVFALPLFSEHGWIGVRLFFVISGFIIAERIHLERSLGRYLFRRYMRVFPLYASITVLSLFLAVVLGIGAYAGERTDSGAPFAPEPVGYLVKSLFIVPQDEWPLFMVGWSLEYEIVFYLLFGLAYFLGGRAVALAAMVGLSVVGLTLAGLTRPVMDSYFMYFLFGCLAREALAREMEAVVSASPFVMLAATSAWIFHLYGYLDLTSVGFIFVSGLSFAAMIVYGVSLEKRRLAFRRESIVTRIGDLSFSLYLVHWLVVMIGRELTSGARFTDAEAELVRLSVIVVSLVAAWAVWAYLERPTNRLMHSVVIGRKAAAR